MKKILLIVSFSLFLVSFIHAQETYPASALWELSNPANGGTGGVPSTSGQVNAADELLNNMEINQYTGPENTQRTRIAGNQWPANQTEQIDDVFVQFTISPKTDFTLHVDSVSFTICQTAINTMKANVYWSTDPTFATAEMIEYSTGQENNYLIRDALATYSVGLSATVNSGETFYLRIYPWVDNDPDIRTGKYVCLQNIYIGGKIESNMVAAKIEWPFDADDEAVTTGPVLAEKTKYSSAMKFYGTTNLPTSDTAEDITVGAIQTVSQTWHAETGVTDSLWFQFEARPKVGGTFYVDSVFMYIGGWFSSNLHAEVYFSKDETFTTKTLLISDMSLVGNAVAPIGASLSETVETGEVFYLRIYPYNTNAEVWAKLVAISDVAIMGRTIGVTADPPEVETANVSYISTTFATTGGNIPSDGGSVVTVRGVVWNTTGAPTTDDGKTEDGTGSGSFTSKPTGLTPGTKYYLRAYATNIAGTSYGSEITFTTLAALKVPTVVTSTVSSILVESAEATGTVTEWGGADVTARGFCWNTTGEPTIDDSKSESGSGLGIFNGLLYPLTAETEYYYRAYATNSQGAGYGEVKRFTTQAPQPDVTKTVALDGTGDYTSVQDAFNDVPDNYTGKWTIFVKNGTYKEKLLLAQNKINVILKGEDRDNTILTYDDYSGRVVNGETLGTSTSYSVGIDADDFRAETITIQNTSTAAQAVALRTNGDRQAYYYCNILGYQDTYYTWGGRGTGRIYNKNCIIEGSVDFIFGRDIAVFDSCAIIENRNGGTLTAAATEPESKFGYTFLDCKIMAREIGFDGSRITSFVLGRPWHEEPRVVFIRCEEPATLNSQGWSTWNVTPALYAEYQCYGPGSATSGRISISRQLTDEEALEYTVANIFAKDANPRYSYDWMPETLHLSAVEQQNDVIPVPKEYNLAQNYPNPFNPATTIRYSLPEKGHVKLSLFNVLGKEVLTLIDEEKPAGAYSFKMNLQNLPTGVYFYKIKAGTFCRTRKMMLIK